VTNILAYADDIAQLATSEDDLQRYMTKWDNTFEHFGLRLNRENPKVLVISNTVLKGERLNQVTEFQYLGSKILENGLVLTSSSRYGDKIDPCMVLQGKTG